LKLKTIELKIIEIGFNKVMEKHRLAILLILIIAIIIAIIKHPELQDRNIVYLEITLIISLLVYELENKYYIIASVIVLFALLTIWDVYQEKQIEGFSNKLKKLKNTRIGKTSERFGNVLMSKGKRKSKKEKFVSTKKYGDDTINDISEEYVKYKESFKPIFKKSSKSTGEAVYKFKQLWGKLKEIF
jgi:hypothetical protein